MLATGRNNNNSSQEFIASRFVAEKEAKSSKREHPLIRFYRSKSSERQLPKATNSSLKLDHKQQDTNNKKKKKKKQQQPVSTNNESTNFSSASSSGYNSHITHPGESTFSQQQQHFYHPATAPHHHAPTHHHRRATQLDSLPAGGFEHDQGGFSDHNIGDGRSWRRSVSLRAPTMLPMMIDDEIELIDDSMDHHHHHHHQQQQQLNTTNNDDETNINSEFQQQQRQYQNYQQHFQLASEQEQEQCVDSKSLNYHFYQNHRLPEPPQQYCATGQTDDVEADDDDADADVDGNQYSQVRRPFSGARTNHHQMDNYIERISHLQQRQQQQMMLASALRQHQLTATDQRNKPNSKSTFNLTNQQQQQQQLHSLTNNNNQSKYSPPVAIYHQPNLNYHQQQFHSLSYKQQQQQPQQQFRRFQPTPFISSQNQPPSISGPRSLSSVNTNRKLALPQRLEQQRNKLAGSSSSSGSQSATDSGALVGGGGQSTEPISSDISAISSNQFVKLIKSDSDQISGQINNNNKMQTSGSVNQQRLHHNHQQQQQHHSSNRIKSPALSQSSRKLNSPLQQATDNQGSGDGGDRHQLTLGFCGKFAKLLLFISNILFWSAGIALGAWGILSLVDDHKYNLSQLLVFEPNSKMSLFQLLSWSFITLGCATILVGFCGCSAIFKNNRWILGLYIFLILAIFALDLATGLLAMIFQERLVANVRLRLANKLRSDYGVQASFTAAIDYIQTKYECCGLEGHFDYDQSLWRLQRLGGFEATVARTCCHLRNTFDDQAHVNPRPVNESMCQSNDVRFHQSYRYRKGCLDDLERLIRHKIWYFTIGCGAVGGVILLSLLFATCFCRAIPTPNGGSRKSSKQQQQQSSQDHKKQQQSGGFILNQHPHQTTNAQLQHQRHYNR